MGYTALKFDPFGSAGRELTRSELRSARALVEAVRHEVGDDVDILIECHGRFSVGQAVEAIKALVEYEPFWFEEPIPAKAVESQAWVTSTAAALGARIATGEHSYSRFEFQDLLRTHACHILQPDLVYSGGFMETKKIAAMAEAGYVGVAPHNCDGPGRLAASVHVGQHAQLRHLGDLRRLRCALARFAHHRRATTCRRVLRGEATAPGSATGSTVTWLSPTPVVRTRA